MGAVSLGRQANWSDARRDTAPIPPPNQNSGIAKAPPAPALGLDPRAGGPGGKAPGGVQGQRPWPCFKSPDRPPAPPRTPPASRPASPAPSAPTARARAPIACRSAGGSASTASIAAASAAGSPGGTRQPVTPCRTVSTGPPRSAAITGRAIACASITTRPNASGWVEACTTTIGQHQRRRHVVALPDQPQPVRHAQPLRLAHQPFGVAPPPLVGADQHAPHIPPRQPRQRVDQHRLALPAGQAAGQHHHRRALRQPPGRAPAAPGVRPTPRPGRTPPDRPRAGSRGCASGRRRAGRRSVRR